VILDYSWEEKWVEEKRYSWSNMMEKGGLKKPLLPNRSQGKGLFDCAGERKNSRTPYEVRDLVFQFLESTRRGTPR
jgi:hypothetical protein